jgi:hypothetical protein
MRVGRLQPKADAIFTTPTKFGTERPFSSADILDLPIAAAKPKPSCDRPAAVRSTTTARPKAIAMVGSVEVDPIGRPRVIFLRVVVIGRSVAARMY